MKFLLVRSTSPVPVCLELLFLRQVFTLILSKLDYADLVFYPLPQFLLRRLQRVQFAATRLVLGHYVKNFRMYLKSDGFQSMREEI